jgi:hypothetical protein
MPPRATIPRLALSALLVAAPALLSFAGCANLPAIPGTTVTDTRENRQVIEVCEKYRHALEDRDAETLLQLASPQYFEDSGTPKAEDDYGYDGLKQVINTRLQSLKAVRYNIQYRNVEYSPNRNHVNVDIRYDASYQLATELGDRWERKQSEKRMELEYDKAGHRWLFTTGM